MRAAAAAAAAHPATHPAAAASLQAAPPAAPAEPSAAGLASKPSVWVPGRDSLEEGEELDYDRTAYDCLSAFSLDWPALSFDLVRDALGDGRAAFPHSLLLVAGTQAASAKLNHLAVLKVSNLTRGGHGPRAPRGPGAASDDDDSASDMDEDGEGKDAVLHARRVQHTGGVNRVRSALQRPGLVAAWADTGAVGVWDLSALLAEVAAEAAPAPGAARPAPLAPRQTHAHSAEGFALDWSPAIEGRLASGDCRAGIHVWEPAPGGRWAVGGALKGHAASVEDLQWSPAEGTVFASASADRSLRVWDTRAAARGAMLAVEGAHAADVNVIAWNRLTSHLLASGGDDGALRVWDLRTFASAAPAAAAGGAAAGGGAPAPVAHFAHHRAPVTSVEWAPFEASVLATTAADGAAAVWDLALERDPEEEAAADDGGAEAPEDLPPQLLFVHAGQRDPKEAHWHPQIPGLLASTGADGFQLWKAANVGPA